MTYVDVAVTGGGFSGCAVASQRSTPNKKG